MTEPVLSVDEVASALMILPGISCAAWPVKSLLPMKSVTPEIFLAVLRLRAVPFSEFGVVGDFHLPV